MLYSRGEHYETLHAYLTATTSEAREDVGTLSEVLTAEGIETPLTTEVIDDLTHYVGTRECIRHPHKEDFAVSYLNRIRVRGVGNIVMGAILDGDYVTAHNAAEFGSTLGLAGRYQAVIWRWGVRHMGKVSVLLEAGEIINEDS